MLNISMVRVDERLVHGQIIIKWIEAKGANRIVIIDDETALDPILNKILKLTLPKSIKLNIFSIEEGVNFLRESYLHDNVIVLVRELQTVRKIYEKGIKIKEVNVGRIPSDIGKKKVYANVFLSDGDIDVIKFFRNEGVSMYIQMVPDSLSVNVYDLDF